MPLVLDPSIRVLPLNHKIFVLHPGDGKRFYGDFQRENAVFLDIPGIKFPTAPNADDEETRKLLRMGRAIAGWNRSGRKPAQKPSDNLEKYKVTIEGRAAPRFMREAQALYKFAKPGDLIVIPGSGYDTDVLFAEVEGPFDPEFVVGSIRYNYEKLPARKVSFLPRRFAKHEFGSRLVRLMQNRQALIRIQDKEDIQSIYEYAYGDYIWGNNSGSYFEVQEQVIDQRDFADALSLSNLYGALYVALKADELEKFLGLPSDEDRIEKYYNRELFGDVSIEVHSPGYFGRPLKDQALAGFMAAMVVFASNGIQPAEASDLKVINSANGAQSVCDIENELEADLKRVMVMVANSNMWWDKVCAKQQRVTKGVGLKTKATIKGSRLAGN